jgi:hypothetical protein
MRHKTSLFEQISMNSKQIALFNKIRRKGRNEQELQYLFPSVYGSHAVTRNTIGQRRQSDKQLFHLIQKHLTYA